MPDVPRILVIVASTRPVRTADRVMHWLRPQLQARTDLTTSVADLRDLPLPYYTSERPASLLTRADYPDELLPWADQVDAADGFLIVTPEYNRGYPAALKSALDSLYPEWVRKPVAFAGYGGWSGGTRAVEQLRLVAVELQMAPVRATVVLQFAQRLIDENGVIAGELAPLYEGSVTRMLDDLVWWSVALNAARATGG